MTHCSARSPIYSDSPANCSSRWRSDHMIWTQSSHELDAARSDTKKLRQDIEALEQFRKTAEQQMTASARPPPTTPGPSAAAAPEQQAAQDELRRQNADLQQQVALRSRDLDAARAETSKLRQDIEALNQLRKTQEEQTAAAASARPPAPGPSAPPSRNSRRHRTHCGVRLPISSNRSRNVRTISKRPTPKPASCGKITTR